MRSHTSRESVVCPCDTHTGVIVFTPDVEGGVAVHFQERKRSNVCFKLVRIQASFLEYEI